MPGILGGELLPPQSYRAPVGQGHDIHAIREDAKGIGWCRPCTGGGQVVVQLLAVLIGKSWSEGGGLSAICASSADCL